MRPLPTVGALGCVLGCVLSAAAVPVVGYGSLFGSTAYLPRLGAALGVGVVAAALAAGAVVVVHLLRRPRPVAGAAVAAVAGAVVLLVVAPAWRLVRPPGADGSAGPPGLLTDAIEGARLLVTTNQPVDLAADVFVVPYLLTTASTALGLLAVAARPPLLPLLPPALALFAQLLLCAGVGGRFATAAVVVFVATVPLLLALRRPGPARGTGSGRARSRVFALVAAVTGLAAVAAVGSGSGALSDLAETLGPTRASGSAATPELDRFDPRDRWRPAATEERITPLALLRAELDEPVDEPRFSVRLLAGTDVRRVAVAHLDRFDGAAWGADARFRPAGTVLRTPDPADRTDVRAVFEVRSLPSRLLPALGEPRRLHLDSPRGLSRPVSFDRTGGMLSAGAIPTGWRYTESGASTDRAPDGPLPDTGRCNRYTDDPRFGDRRREWLPQADPSREQLESLAARMRTDLPYSPDAPAGSSLAATLRVLADDGPRSGGYAEQHAAAFSLLACAAGRPARVAVGYRLPDVAPGRTAEVGAHDAHAWAEVWFGRAVGWVAFDPTDPDKDVTAYDSGLSGAAAPKDLRPSIQPSPVGTDAGPQPGPGPATPTWSDRLRHLAGPLLLMLGAAAALGGAFLAVRSVRRAQRRRRQWRRERAALERLRHDPDPRRGLLAAWGLLIGSLRHGGLRVPDSVPPEGVAAAAGPVPSRALAMELAEVVNAGRYGPDPTTSDQARRAWELSDAITHRSRS